MPRKVALPRLGPNPTPITEYLALHPGASLMSLAKVSGLHYDTVHKAERGQNPPNFVTLLKLQNSVGIPVMAWAKTKAVMVLMEQTVDPNCYNEKQNRWRKKKRDTDPEYKARDDVRFQQREKRRQAARRGEPVVAPPVRLIGEA